MKNLKKVIATSVLTSLFAGGVLLSACNAPSEDKDESTEKSEENKPVMNEAKCMAKTELKTALRKLWEDHVIWTRNVILNIIDDLPGTDQAVARLLKNQDEIGDAIKPYYGNEAGKKLTSLLRTHILQAADLLKAAKANNKVAFDKVSKDWYSNADEIAEFLSTANPNWKLEDMKTMMHNHLKFTIEEAVARQKKDYNDDITAYDKVHEEILKMSDMLYMGIVEQFPEKVQ